ncbi:acanthoscurrin-2 [Sutterella sp. CAG:351]|nr:acanthoscurrin-2 [Sutterella sp. CAG:351]
MLLDFKQRLQPSGRSLLNFGSTRTVIIEEPVRENAVLRDPVHFLSPDLILDRRAVRTDHSRMKTLIPVCLWHCDEVLETFRHRLIKGVQGTQREVALLRRPHDHPETVYVQRLTESDVLITHRVIDAVHRLVAPDHAGLDTGLREHAAGFMQNPLENVLSLFTRSHNSVMQHPIADRMHVEKGEFLQFAEYVIHAETVSNRHINIERLAGNAAALFIAHDAESAHVMHTVSKLHEDDADILRHGEQQLSEGFCRGNLSALEFELIEFGDAVDDVCHFDAEAFRHLNLRHAGVFQHVVHESCLNGHAVHMPARENRSHRERMRDVRLTRFAELSQMMFVSVPIGLENGLAVAFRQIKPAPGQQLVCRNDLDVSRLHVEWQII